MTETAQREHNKSGKTSLTVLDYDDETINRYAEMVKNQVKTKSGPIKDSPCKLFPSRDGRLSDRQKKVCFAYQVVAFQKFGREELAKVPATKSRESLLISHLCGNGPKCCSSNHLRLEAKYINDERAHCHFTLENAYKKGGYDAMEQIFNAGGCPHDPKCCSRQ